LIFDFKIQFAIALSLSVFICDSPLP
jgi:hypothetical protein